MKEEFVAAIRSRSLVRVAFFSEEDHAVLSRTCAPMDIGPSRRYHDGRDRYHLWDYESDQGPHPLSILPESIQKLEVLGKTFDPADFITWDTGTSPWFVSRDWGQYS